MVEQLDTKRLLDLRGLVMAPIVDIRCAIDEMKSGEVLKVVSNDGGLASDVEVFCRYTGNLLQSSINHQESFIFWIKKRHFAY